MKASTFATAAITIVAAGSLAACGSGSASDAASAAKSAAGNAASAASSAVAQATVVVSGAGNLDIRYLTKISDYALAIEKIEAMKQALSSASRDGLTPEEVAKLQLLLG